jgi:catechol 2,3-dioxygenase-like lactoylglutathione lyase family enzyme
MALHELRSVTIGVPDPASVARFYVDFGLEAHDGGAFSTLDGGRQLFLEPAPSRRLVELVVGVDDADDLARVRRAMVAAGHDVRDDERRLSVVELTTGVRVTLEITPRLVRPTVAAAVYNGPGRPPRSGQRSPAVMRSGPVQPRRLGHAVLTTTDFAATSRFFADLIGFKVSDYIGDVGIFLRCSVDHHNLLLLSAPAVYLHHTAWEVDDVDDVGRGAQAMLAAQPDRHVWGLGRHHAGSNFFWYLRDPAGNYCEYYADLDVIPDDVEWIPEAHPGQLGLYNWGPTPPPSFLEPEDLAELVASQRVS